jgi:hypothetical protein
VGGGARTVAVWRARPVGVTCQEDQKRDNRWRRQTPEERQWREVEEAGSHASCGLGWHYIIICLCTAEVAIK